MKNFKKNGNHFAYVLLLSALALCTTLNNLVIAAESDDILQKLFTAGRMERFIELTKSTNHGEPDSLKSQSLVAAANFMRCHYQEAISGINKVLLSAEKIHSDDETGLLALRGACYYRLSMYQQALADFNAALKMPKCPPEVANSRDLTEKRLNGPKSDSDKKTVTDASSVDDKLKAALNESNNMYFQDLVEWARDQNYGSPLVEVSLSNKFPGKGSMSNWQKAVKLGKEAQSLEAENKLDKAIDNYKDAIALYPYDPWLYSALALSYTTRKTEGDRENSIAAFKNALTLDDSNWQIWNDLGAVLYGNGHTGPKQDNDLTESKHAFEMALTKNKDIDSSQRELLAHCITIINSISILGNQMKDLEKTGQLKILNGGPNPNEMPNGYFLSPIPVR